MEWLAADVAGLADMIGGSRLHLHRTSDGNAWGAGRSRLSGDGGAAGAAGALVAGVGFDPASMGLADL